jgi:hypothetical protein
MSHNPSICIPRVFANIGDARIRKVFDQLNIGKIARVDIVERKNERGEPYNRVFIHFEYWFNTQESHAVRRKLLDGKEVKVVYDDPWFWKVSLNTWTAQPAAPAARSVPHIDWEDDRRESRAYDERRAPSQYDDRRPQYDDRRPQYDDRRPQYDDRRQQEPRHHYDDRKQEPRPSQQPRSERPQQKPHKQEQGRPKQEQKQKQVQRASTATVPVQASTATVPIQAQLPVAKRILTKKTKQQPTATQPTATQPTATATNLEEGEIVETDGTQLTAENLKDIDELYGDLN